MDRKYFNNKIILIVLILLILLVIILSSLSAFIYYKYNLIKIELSNNNNQLNLKNNQISELTKINDDLNKSILFQKNEFELLNKSYLSMREIIINDFNVSFNGIIYQKKNEEIQNIMDEINISSSLTSCLNWNTYWSEKIKIQSLRDIDYFLYLKSIKNYKATSNCDLLYNEYINKDSEYAQLNQNILQMDKQRCSAWFDNNINMVTYKSTYLTPINLEYNKMNAKLIELNMAKTNFITQCETLNLYDQFYLSRYY